MAILCLATDLDDLKKRLGDIIVAYRRDKTPIYCRDIKADGAMTVLLKDAMQPNLVQTLENNPAFVHVQNMNNTGDGQEAGIILHSKSSFGGAWAIYGKRTTSGFKSDLIFRGRTGSSSSAERMRITKDGDVCINRTGQIEDAKLSIQCDATQAAIGCLLYTSPSPRD